MYSDFSDFCLKNRTSSDSRRPLSSDSLGYGSDILGVLVSGARWSGVDECVEQKLAPLTSVALLPPCLAQ